MNAHGIAPIPAAHLHSGVDPCVAVGETRLPDAETPEPRVCAAGPEAEPWPNQAFLTGTVSDTVIPLDTSPLIAPSSWIPPSSPKTPSVWSDTWPSVDTLWP